MKTVIVERVREEAKFFCDKHKDREAFTEVRTMCWYGSKFDLMNVTVNLCDECMEEFYADIKQKFGVSPVEDESVFVPRCYCREN